MIPLLLHACLRTYHRQWIYITSYDGSNPFLFPSKVDVMLNVTLPTWGGGFFLLENCTCLGGPISHDGRGCLTIWYGVLHHFPPKQLFSHEDVICRNAIGVKASPSPYSAFVCSRKGHPFPLEVMFHQPSSPFLCEWHPLRWGTLEQCTTVWSGFDWC